MKRAVPLISEPPLLFSLLFFSFLEQRSGEIPLRRIRQNRHNRLPFPKLLGQLQSRRHIGAAGNAAHDAFHPCQVTGRLDGLVVRHDVDVAVDLLVEVFIAKYKCRKGKRGLQKTVQSFLPPVASVPQSSTSSVQSL